MESFVATCDPVLKQAARIAGFADVMVQDTEDGMVVVTRHRFGKQWSPFEHLAPGQCALDAFYGTAFWERSDVLAMYQRQEAGRLESLHREGELISKDLRREWHKQVVRRAEGKHEAAEAIALLAARRRR